VIDTTGTIGTAGMIGIASQCSPLGRRRRAEIARASFMSPPSWGRSSGKTP
jgi:hypothetical protein